MNEHTTKRPPGAPSLAFHRDSPYFEPFFPQEVVATVWIALDDMDPEIGPLVYVPGSHLWPKGGNEDEEVQLGDNEDEEVKSGENERPSTSGTRILRDFFNKDNSEGNDNFNIKGKDGKMSENNVAKFNKNAGIGSYNEEARHYPQVALRQAAKNSGHDPDELEYISTSGLKAGGLSIHDGRTWHGSGPNASPFFRPITADNKALRGHSSNSSPNPRPRRGIGIHYVPANARWKSDLAVGSQIWGRYVDGDTWGNSSDSGNCNSNGELEQLNDTFFPIAWSPSSR